MQKILLIGSAGYIQDWFNTRGVALLQEGYELRAINNAWAVAPDKVKVWYHSSDYFAFYTTLRPAKEQLNCQVVTHFTTSPLWYKKRGSGTMLLNSLYSVLNDVINAGDKVKLAVAGNDLIYKNKETDHFYKMGTADPMRFGEDYLKETLLQAKKDYEDNGCEIFNAGGQEETLLPFVRL